MAVQLQKLLRSSNCPQGLQPSLHVWNRSAEKTKVLSDDPELASTALGSPAHLATCEIVFVMLAEDSAVDKASFAKHLACQLAGR
jgi:hypothetical protein